MVDAPAQTTKEVYRIPLHRTGAQEASMQLHNEFTVDAPIGEVWSVLEDIPRVARCMPGAELTGSSGDTHTGVVKVKLGPMRVTYEGKANVTELDGDRRRASMIAEGRDVRGQGRAKAAVEVAASDVDGRTRVSIQTDLDITGRVAQFGRGLLEDVSAALVDEFAAALQAEVSGRGEEPVTTPVPGPPEGAPASEDAAGISEPAAADEALDAAIILRTVAKQPPVIFALGVVLGIILARAFRRRGGTASSEPARSTR
jgi:uncharacterized protein